MNICVVYISASYDQKVCYTFPIVSTWLRRIVKVVLKNAVIVMFVISVDIL
jgi:hypothetical protein